MTKCGEIFIEYLKQQGYEFESDKTSDGQTVVSIPVEDHVAKCIFHGDEEQYFSLFIVLGHVLKENFTDALVVCNNINASYNWATFFIDREMDVIIHDDAILCAQTAALEAAELIIRLTNIADEAKPSLEKFLCE